MKVGNLKDQIGNQDRAILKCSCCGGEYSANAGDYFMHAKSDVLKCCERPLVRVVKETIYRRV